MTAMIKLQARAKVNLGLDVLRRREDGYHEVKMVMQAIDLFDVISIEKSDKKGITFFCTEPSLPQDESNLAYKACKLLMDEFDVNEGVSIVLDKKIPMAAGMAGGSTDAAAVFKGVNELFSLGLSETELMERAVTLGADIPYCIMGGTALSEGIGEVLTPLTPMPDCVMLIAKPAIDVSTAFVYKNLHLDEVKDHPDIDGMVEAIQNHCLEGITARMGNVLESVTVPHYPVIDEIKKTMKEYHAINALMSGSGPTVFGIYNTVEDACLAAGVLKERKLAAVTFVTKPIS